MYRLCRATPRAPGRTRHAGEAGACAGFSPLHGQKDPPADLHPCRHALPACSVVQAGSGGFRVPGARNPAHCSPVFPGNFCFPRCPRRCLCPGLFFAFLLLCLFTAFLCSGSPPSCGMPLHEAKAYCCFTVHAPGFLFPADPRKKQRTAFYENMPIIKIARIPALSRILLNPG